MKRLASLILITVSRPRSNAKAATLSQPNFIDAAAKIDSCKITAQNMKYYSHSRRKHPWRNLVTRAEKGTRGGRAYTTEYRLLVGL